jgi:hypothetical protein
VSGDVRELAELLRDSVRAAPPRTELAVLLDDLDAFVRRFVILDEAQAAAVALWVAHAWAVDAANATPYLHVTSAEPESGKTRLLEVAHELVPKPLSTMNISDAALFRAIASKRPCLFLDEVDAVFNKHTQKTGAKDELRSLLNAGYRRGQVVYRMGGGNHTTLESFEVFCPKALAGLGGLPGTLVSRCVRVELKRRRRDEPVEDFIPTDFLAETAALKTRLEELASGAVESLRGMSFIRVEGLRDRQNEVWRPLLAIAELAGPTWLTRGRRAAVALAAGETSDEPSLGLLLLTDIRAVFEQRQAERIATADLIRTLAGIDESPWGEWWIDAKTEEPNRSGSRRLAQLLRPYGIRPKVIRIGELTPRGYERDDFADAWERFLPPPRPDATSATSATPEAQSQANVADVADVAHGRQASENRYCDACDDHDRCSATHRCAEIDRLAAEPTLEDEEGSF